jgi:ATP-dependent helicase/nuclease subunit A
MNKEQQIASNPQYSIWLSASAGSGKTKVLTDRVLRILLDGDQANKILCLTFTNAAASQMQERIYQRMSKWAGLKQNQLKEELYQLTGYQPSSLQIKRAKGLFAQYLQSQAGLNIHTIHSFCQKVLKQFPFEAGVGANFNIIDEINQQKIPALIGHALIEDESHGALVSTLLSKMHDIKFSELTLEILNEQIKFGHLFAKFPNRAAYQEHLSLQFNVLSFEQIANQCSEKLIALQPSITHEHFASSIKHFLAVDFADGLEALKPIFLTQTLAKRQKLLSKAEGQKDSGQLQALLEAQDAVYMAVDQLSCIDLVAQTLDLYSLAHAIITKYQEHKKAGGFLDYDDLIYYTWQLLTASEFKDWILYKLDGGINHILVDEAQDTNLNQWQLILAMISDFVAGQQRQGQDNKSIFVVGDEKQSIYSFQGARYEYFAQVKEQILQQLASSRKKFQVVNLSISYRSSQLILQTVDTIFNYVRGVDAALFESNNFSLNCHHQEYGGTVEIWPAYSDSGAEEDFWPILAARQKQNDSKSRMAKDIAAYIKNSISTKKVLFSTGKPVAAEDFMILLRQRGDLANKIVTELKALQLPVSGLDRIDLFADLSVMDLLAAAKFSLAPHDELNLACLLKSPIFNLDDAKLYEIAKGRSANLYQEIATCEQWAAIYQQLLQLTALAHNNSIYDFFYILVYGLNNLINFLSYNGPESIDAINELLNLAAKFEKEVSCSLQEFLLWCGNANLELKRDNNTTNVVRIMTVHGAKGLQAPIVIVAENSLLPKSSGKFLWHQDWVLAAVNKVNAPAVYQAIKERDDIWQYQEYLRLLYVAATRSCEQLVFCSYSNRQELSEKCWHHIVSSALEANGQHLCLQSDIKRTERAFESHKIQALPLINLDAQEVAMPQGMDLHLQANSPFDSNKASWYGQIAHKIMEEALGQKNLKLLQEHQLLAMLPLDYRAELMQAFRRLSLEPCFCQLLKMELKCEVAISIERKMARIDLLAFSQNKVIIIDYKTDRNPPANQQKVSEKYLEQLKCYVTGIAAIYPDRTIEAKILWLMSANLMDITI